VPERERPDGLIPVGRVGRPHGLDGAFVVEQASDDDRRYEVGATLYVEGEPANVVLSRRVGGRRRAVKLDRAVVRGQELAVRRADLPEPDPGHLYVFQLAGLDVVEEGGGRLGRVRDVLPGVANDNLELDSDLLIPLVEDVILDIDLATRTILVARGFGDDG